MLATMSGVFLSVAEWKSGPLKLSGVPPAGSSLLTAAASPRTQASYSAAARRVGIVLRLRSREAEGALGSGGSDARGE